MQWALGNRPLVLSIGLATVTFLTHLTLFGLASAAVDPVIFVSGGPDSEFRAHGMPTLSWVGLFVWLGILGLHSLASNVVAARLLHLDRFTDPSFIACLFGGSACLAAVVHPTFLLKVLPAEARQSFIAVVETSVRPLREIYFHWGFAKWWGVIFIVHLLLALAAAQILVRRLR